MERVKRYKKRLEVTKVNRYVKRDFTSDKVIHYILYPVVPSTINRSNDFFFHVLQLCWNDKNLLKDRRYRQMLSGLRLKDSVHTIDLATSEDGWFKSCRQNDLAVIGKIAGYFIRMFAYSVGDALYNGEDFDKLPPITDVQFNKFVESLKLENAVIPVLVKLEISEQSSFDTTRFTCVSKDLMNQLADGEESTASFRSNIIRIKPMFYDWAWQLLNMRTLEERIHWLEDKTHFGEQDPDLNATPPNELAVFDIVSQARLVSQRKKYPNKMYPSEIYEKH